MVISTFQGQLQDFAQEVLAEATQEVEDPQSELQVDVWTSSEMLLLTPSKQVESIIFHLS